MLPGFNAFQPLLRTLGPTAQLMFFGALKIPLLFFVNPKVKKLNTKHCEVLVPLNYITKNHVGSMYFGALAIGADCVVAILALHIAQEFKGKSIIPIFKNFKADYAKRAEGDVTFICNEGQKILSMIIKASETKERVTEEIEVLAKVKNEVVATFIMGLSLRVKE